MTDLKTLRGTEVKDQVVLVRTDYNVPMKEGEITDDLRIQASLPTLDYLCKNGASKIVIMAHLGRPEGKPDVELSLKPVVEHLAKLLPKTEVRFVSEVAGPEVEMTLEAMPEGSILVLENLRFYPDEDRNSEDFMREIVDSTHASLFVQDGFGVLHRKSASTDAITKILPTVAGLLVEKEVTALEKVIEKSERPFVLIIGGVKMKDKAPLIEKIAAKADKVLIGGKIAAEGYETTDEKVYVAEDFDSEVTGAKLDIGPMATAKMIELLESAKTVLWNGVLGKVEDPTYATSSTIIAQVLGTKTGVKTVICGGDTTSFVRQLQELHPEFQYSLISTGGGATLALLSGENLPGLK